MDNKDSMHKPTAINNSNFNTKSKKISAFLDKFELVLDNDSKKDSLTKNSTNNASKVTEKCIKKDNDWLKNTDFEESSKSGLFRKNLVDKIQEDFPKTPSPVHAGIIKQKSIPSTLNISKLMQKASNHNTKTEKKDNFDTKALTNCLNHFEENNTSKDHSVWFKNTWKPEVLLKEGINDPINRAASTPVYKIDNSPDPLKIKKIHPLTMITNDKVEGLLERFNILKPQNNGSASLWTKSNDTKLDPVWGKTTNLNRNVREPSITANSSIWNVDNIKENSTYQTKQIYNQSTFLPKINNTVYANSPLTSNNGTTTLTYESIARAHSVNDNSKYSRLYPNFNMQTLYNPQTQQFYYEGNSNNTSANDISSITATSTNRAFLLEEFRHNKSKKYELKSIMGNMVDFSIDQYGSRFIQQKLEIASLEEKTMVFNEILPRIHYLISDVFGNYVIQKFFEYGTTEQRTAMVNAMTGNILHLSLQMYGCRVVQKAIEYSSVDQKNTIVKELEGQVIRCVKDQNGNHVIQKSIECVEADQITFIIDAFQGVAFELATHPYGCRVIQRMFEHCSMELTRPLLGELHDHAEILVKDQYGNYVIQHVLERGQPKDREFVFSKILGNVLPLSKHKFASNVVEKCVAFSSELERKLLIKEVLESKEDGTYALTQMMRDQFANYVVQKMLDTVNKKQCELLILKMWPHMNSLRKYAYGKHLINKVEKIIAQYESRNPEYFKTYTQKTIRLEKELFGQN